MNKKQESPFVNLGISSLLVVFLVLCLVIFSALSLAGANSNMAFSQRLADRKTVYYNACSQAERVLDIVDRRLSENGFESDFSDLGLTRQNDLLTFSVPVGEGQELCVSLHLTPGGKHYYEIDAWKITAVPSSYEETLPLMTMGGE